MSKCLHKKIELYNHTGYPSGDGYDGSDTEWELSCDDCELVIATGDGWDSPKAAYEKWLSQRLRKNEYASPLSRRLKLRLWFISSQYSFEPPALVRYKEYKGVLYVMTITMHAKAKPKNATKKDSL